MKLKEKLALAEIRKLFPWSQGSDYIPALTVYLAGFEKAREMAAAEFEASRERYRGHTFQSGFAGVHRDLLQLGEGEVE